MRAPKTERLPCRPRGITVAAILWTFQILAPASLVGQASKPGAPHVGPSRGSLVLDGGPEASSSVARRFVELAGGPKARIVVIPSAGGNEFARDPGTLESSRTRMDLCTWIRRTPKTLCRTDTGSERQCL